ncbi:hypothetical protein [Nocardioides sp. TF02-7]|uniref:hypothetical protein n=1 Tax=Nocardioides sp. TF02-7 TaxID=2917724 RepID=UPI001F058F33|nr:hypothetical protein [Nocardioides sp. TF02-7]UMG93356.1 hypothetical protein MF408_03525 [Nocardioides sp. TF02-7]
MLVAQHLDQMAEDLIEHVVATARAGGELLHQVHEVLERAFDVAIAARADMVDVPHLAEALRN